MTLYVAALELSFRAKVFSARVVACQRALGETGSCDPLATEQAVVAGIAVDARRVFQAAGHHSLAEFGAWGA